MALTYGFYNSVSGDRTYSAEQMNSFLDGVIEEGVFQAIGQRFEVKATTGRVVTVGTGKAWVAKSWTINDAVISITMPPATAILSRIDAIVLEVNSSPGVRANSIKVIQGTPASSPANPTLTNNEFVQQRVIAHIRRPGDSTDVKQADITNRVGSASLPYVVGAVQSTNIDQMTAQWQANFEAWLANMTATLPPDSAASLAARVLALEGQVDIRNVYRGRNLGTSYTAEQKAAVANGSFAGLQLGDYWVINGETWHIADFNYWKTQTVTKPHLAIVPGRYLYSTGMNATDTTTGGYLGSRLKNTGTPTDQSLRKAYNLIVAAFPAALLVTRNDVLSNATVQGRVTSHQEISVTVEIMNEMAAFGANVNAQRSNDTLMSYYIAFAPRQLALFRERPEMLYAGPNGWWLRDPANSTTFCNVGASGEASWSLASINRGIRPYFGLYGA